MNQTELAILWLADLRVHSKPRNIASYIACRRVRIALMLAASLNYINWELN